jgi:hypothetical protein
MALPVPGAADVTAGEDSIGMLAVAVGAGPDVVDVDPPPEAHPAAPANTRAIRNAARTFPIFMADHPRRWE